MFTYKFEYIKHSPWTGKPKNSIEEMVHDYALRGWRLVAVHQNAANMWYGGKLITTLIFEKPAVKSKEDSGYYYEEDLI